MQRVFVLITLGVIIWGVAACQQSTTTNTNTNASNKNTNSATNSVSKFAVGDEILLTSGFKNPNNGKEIGDLGWYTAKKITKIDGTKVTVEGNDENDKPTSVVVDTEKVLPVPKSGQEKPSVKPGQIVILEWTFLPNMWVGAEVVSMDKDGNIEFAKFQNMNGEGLSTKDDVERMTGFPLSKRWVIPTAEEAEVIRKKINSKTK